MSQADERITYYISLCEQLYNPKTPEEIAEAQKRLELSFPIFSASSGATNEITTPMESASALQMLLGSSSSIYVQTFCFSRLKQLTQDQLNTFSTEYKLQLRTFLLEYAFMHTDLIPFIITQLASLLSIVTLIGWFDVEKYRDVYKDVAQFVEASVDHRIIGFQMLSVLVQDINPPCFTGNPAKFRKAAGEFRDTQLFDICKAAFKTLQEINARQIVYSHAEQEQRLKSVTLDLMIKCFSYDFSGTSPDESGEDLGTIQIPTSWRPLLTREDFLPTFFDSYEQFEPLHMSKVMDCLVQIASIRIALFTEPYRSQFIVAIMQGIRSIIISSRGLDNSDTYNGFCRFLSRFRASVPLNEMVQTPGYLDWISVIAEFSFKAFRSWRFAPNSSVYVLGFWYRLAQSMTYYQQLGEEAIEKLSNMILEVGVAQTYITTSLEAIPVYIEEGLDDPFENEDMMIESLNFLGQIAHKKYKASATALIQLFDPTTIQYQELINSYNIINPEEFKEALEIIETKFAWLIYTMASFVGNRAAFMTSEDVDKMDSEITARVLQLVSVQQTLQNQHRNTFMNEKLDLAFIYFFHQFKKSYMSESNGRDIYSSLSKLFGISDQITMLEAVMRKIISNLQLWADNELVIRKTLELFSYLNSGYGASKNLRKLESTNMLLQNHLSSDMAFFQYDKQSDNRFIYFQILCKLLFADDNTTERIFHEFMKPFDMRFHLLGPLGTIEAFRQEKTRKGLRDIFIDLHGFASSIQSRSHFFLFFDWFDNHYSSALLHAVEAWSPDPIVNTLLKFYLEYTSNKNQRAGFDISSPNGILIFKDASEIISIYSKQILKQVDIPKSQIYDYKYEGIGLCFKILANCLGGKYINFGILWLYQDEAVNKAFESTLEMIVGVPLDDLLSFPILSHSFFNLLDEFVKERQLMAMPIVSHSTFLHIIQACERGIESADSVTFSHACSVINHMCCYVIQETEKLNRQQGRRKLSQAHWIMTYLTQFRHILPSLLTGLLQALFFDSKSDQWTLSRPLYPLIVLERDYTFKYIMAVVEAQLPERQFTVKTILDGLLDGINYTLSTKDRERFTHNVSVFRKPLNAHSIKLMPLTTPPTYY
ncbi:armadillo-type protein [Sporodiniella umbellata]|nr:armadillo-type protein [Sporodiniella umbellata]